MARRSSILLLNVEAERIGVLCEHLAALRADVHMHPPRDGGVDLILACVDETCTPADLKALLEPCGTDTPVVLIAESEQALNNIPDAWSQIVDVMIEPIRRQLLVTRMRIGPLMTWGKVDLALMWTGVIGGSAAYAVSRLLAMRKQRSP
jgi:hypothetical protein